jgi:outer membrane receptor protein involved in Fe transport
VSRRLQNNWQFQASYSATRIDEPFPTAYEEALLDPNHEIFTANENWEWGARISGSYLFPHRILVSSNFEHRSGDPWARQFEFEGGTNVPSLLTNVELIGTRRLPHINLLDFRFQKGFAMGGSRELQLRANVYNLLNTQVETDVNALSGPDFGVVLTRVLPRIVGFEAQFRF